MRPPPKGSFRLTHFSLAVTFIVGFCCCAGFYDLDGLESRSAEPTGIDESDASADVAVDAAPGFCDLVQPEPALCADFERGDLMIGWNRMVPSPGIFGDGRLSLTMPARDGTHALLTTLPPGPTQASATLLQFFDVPTSTVADLPARLELSFDLRVDGPEPHDNVVIALASFGFGNGGTFVDAIELSYFSDRLVIAEADHVLSSVAAPFGNGWQRVDFYIELDSLDAGGSNAEVFVEGPSVLKAAIPPALAKTERVQLALGSNRGLANEEATSVAIDNVVLRTISKR